MDLLRRLEIRAHHILVLGLAAIVYVVASLSGVGVVATPQTAYAAGSHTYATPGTYTFTVPVYGTLTVTANGAGGGGSGQSTLGCMTAQMNGQDGTLSNFQSATPVQGNGGGGTVTNCVGNPPYANPGTASGGDTNTTGGGASGGASPYAYIDDNGNPVDPNKGGNGGQAVKSWSYGASGAPTVGASITVTVGTGGAGGTTGVGGSAGSPGSVSISWTDLAPPTCTLSPSSQTVVIGNPAVLSYTITGTAASASINSVSVPTTASGSYTPSPSATTAYTMTVSNASGQNTCGPATVTVDTQGQTGILYGYAWSDTIGWISLNCTNTNTCASVNYGLSIDANGILSGYAWSDTVGWISANQGDLTGCPQGTCRAKLQSLNLNGWLKALSGGSAQSGAWDGFISFSGNSPSYGVTENASGGFTGFAWGSTVVGWVDFSYASTTSAACPAGYAIVSGACVRQCTPSYSCSGSTIQHTDSSCNVTNVTTCVSPSFCSAGQSTCINPTPIFNQSGSLSGHLQAIPTLVPQNASTKVYWDVSNVSNCSVTGSNGDHWTGSASGAGGKVSAALVQQTTFTLQCTKTDNSTLQETVTINIVPVFQER